MAAKVEELREPRARRLDDEVACSDGSRDPYSWLGVDASGRVDSRWERTADDEDVVLETAAVAMASMNARLGDPAVSASSVALDDLGWDKKSVRDATELTLAFSPDELARYLRDGLWSRETMLALLRAGGGVAQRARWLVQDFRSASIRGGEVVVTVGASAKP